MDINELFEAQKILFIIPQAAYIYTENFNFFLKKVSLG